MGKATTRAQNKYISKKYDRINLIVPNGNKEIIEQRARDLNLSTAKYINNLIDQDLKRG